MGLALEGHLLAIIERLLLDRTANPLALALHGLLELLELFRLQRLLEHAFLKVLEIFIG